MSKEINDDFMVTVFAFVIMHTVTLPSLLKAPNLDFASSKDHTIISKFSMKMWMKMLHDNTTLSYKHP